MCQLLSTCSGGAAGAGRSAGPRCSSRSAAPSATGAAAAAQRRSSSCSSSSVSLEGVSIPALREQRVQQCGQPRCTARACLQRMYVRASSVGSKYRFAQRKSNQVIAHNKGIIDPHAVLPWQPPLTGAAVWQTRHTAEKDRCAWPAITWRDTSHRCPARAVCASSKLDKALSRAPCETAW